MTRAERSDEVTRDGALATDLGDELVARRLAIPADHGRAGEADLAQQRLLPREQPAQLLEGPLTP